MHAAVDNLVAPCAGAFPTTNWSGTIDRARVRLGTEWSLITVALLSFVATVMEVANFINYSIAIAEGGAHLQCISSGAFIRAAIRQIIATCIRVS